MKIAVIGAAGAMAAVVMRDLLEFMPGAAITAIDRREPSFVDSRIDSEILDIRDISSTTKIIRDHRAVLNCATYYLNLDVMRAALAAKVPYVDLGGLYHITRKQYLLHDEFVRAGIPAILGMGSTPGITNMMAAALARRFDTVREIHVRVGCQDETQSDSPLPVPYALDTVLDEFSLEPMLFTDGKAVAVAPMSGEEVIEFPPPAGKMLAIYTLHSEVAMFPRSFPALREASFKVAFPVDFTEKVRFLVKLGFASREPVVADVSPRKMLLALTAKAQTDVVEPRDCDVLRVIMTGDRGGKVTSEVAESVILPHAVWKIAAGSLDTGVPISIVGQMLASSEITTPGVQCPETCVPVDAFFDRLARRNIHVNFPG